MFKVERRWAAHLFDTNRVLDGDSALLHAQVCCGPCHSVCCARGSLSSFWRSRTLDCPSPPALMRHDFCFLVCYSLTYNICMYSCMLEPFQEPPEPDNGDHLL